MTTSTTSATSGKVIASLVKEYGALIHSNDEGIRNWWRSASKTSSVRDLSATITKAKELGEVRGIKPAYANNARLAVVAFDIKGADKVPVQDIMKVVEVAQRALKVDGALVLAGAVADFAEFEEKARKADSTRKAGKAPRGKAKVGKVTVKAGTVDALVAQALANFAELDDVTLTDFDSAEKLIGALKSAVASSRAVSIKHPVVAKR